MFVALIGKKPTHHLIYFSFLNTILVVLECQLRKFLLSLENMMTNDHISSQ